MPPSPTPAPTATRPTRTPVSTPTPWTAPGVVNAATQRAVAFAETLHTLEQAGYLTSTEGQTFELEPFREELNEAAPAWWLQEEVLEDFVFSANWRWSTAINGPGISGCGLVFGVNGETAEQAEGYVVFLDNTRLIFRHWTGMVASDVKPVMGTERFDYGNPAQAELVVAVTEGRAIVSVDGNITAYKLPLDHTTRGGLGPGLISSTSRGYGTRCEMSNARVWLAKSSQ